MSFRALEVALRSESVGYLLVSLGSSHVLMSGPSMCRCRPLLSDRERLTCALQVFVGDGLPGHELCATGVQLPGAIGGTPARLTDGLLPLAAHVPSFMPPLSHSEIPGDRLPRDLVRDADEWMVMVSVGA